MAQNETHILKRIMLQASKMGIRVFRNHTGGIFDKHGAFHRFGLCKGSSDIIGWKTIEITPDMINNRIAVFTAIEVKTPTGRVSKDQKNFIDRVNEAGGIAFICDDEKNLKKLVDGRPNSK